MAYQGPVGRGLDYALCSYGASRLRFRGPAEDPGGDARYVAFLGGAETFGRFVAEPFPALVARATGYRAINLGAPNAGLDAFLHDPEVPAIASRAAVRVLQVPSGATLSNRLYTVHPRRNDRFLRPSAILRGLYPDVDFADIHFIGHLLAVLRRAGPDRFEIVQNELRDAWVSRMRLLLERIGGPTYLLWMAATPPGQADAAGTAWVDGRMITSVADAVCGVIEATASPEALADGVAGMVFAETEAPAARCLPGPRHHRETARAIAEVLLAGHG